MPAPSLVDLIGNTPLVRLHGPSEATGCEILGKCEFLNPGGSVKDRTALGIIRAAQRDGSLRPGGIIVEGTAGNTGIGLTLLANALGYRSAVVMPMNQSREKMDLIELLGAELHLVQATGYDDPNHYVHQARRLAEKLNVEDPAGAIWANQFDNLANRDIHRVTTGTEIIEQTGGAVDGFVCAVGTGGTLAGVAAALREHNPKVVIGLADPPGSALYSHYTSGRLELHGWSIAEGIGISHLTRNIEDLVVDLPLQIEDGEALTLLYDLLRDEGFCLGASSGVNVAGAVRMARELGPGHTIVTVLCDHGTRYQSRLYNPTFLASKGLPVPPWLQR